MNSQDVLWLDSERYDEFAKELRALCERLRYMVIDVQVRQSGARYPSIDIELMQAPRQQEKG